MKKQSLILGALSLVVLSGCGRLGLNASTDSPATIEHADTDKLNCEKLTEVTKSLYMMFYQAEEKIKKGQSAPRDSEDYKEYIRKVKSASYRKETDSVIRNYKTAEAAYLIKCPERSRETLASLKANYPLKVYNIN